MELCYYQQNGKRCWTRKANQTKLLPKQPNNNKYLKYLSFWILKEIYEKKKNVEKYLISDHVCDFHFTILYLNIYLFILFIFFYEIILAKAFKMFIYSKQIKKNKKN